MRGPTLCLMSREGNRSHRIEHGQGFAEVGERCFVARYEFVNVNVGLVAGERGVLVVDTHASEVEARAVLDDVRRLGLGDVVAVVNTHAHWDHVLGNAVFADAYDGLELFTHEETAAVLPGQTAELQEQARVEALEEGADPRVRDIASARLVVPGRTFSSVGVVDLGDRFVELAHLGRGHTGGDAVVRVPDADVVFAGDLVEEFTGGGEAPGFGPDCYPLEWPATLDLLVGMLGEDSVVVPGHGLPVDRRYVDDQRGSIGLVAETIRGLVERGTAPAEMADAAEWPYPAERLEHAFTRGAEMLPRTSRSLPLL